ncbi:MAG: hypothetical protein ABIQ40_15990 [Bacteroidia bacterium]
MNKNIVGGADKTAYFLYAGLLTKIVAVTNTISVTHKLMMKILKDNGLWFSIA